MADGTWWNSSSRTEQRFENGTPSSSSSSSGHNQPGSFGWSCTDSGGSVAFPEANGSHGMMDLALNTQSMDWNQSTLFRGDHHGKGDADFRSMIQESTTTSDLSFDMETAMYGSPTAILQAGLFGSSEIGRNHHQPLHGHSSASNMEQRYGNGNYQYGGNNSNNYGLMMNSSSTSDQQQLLQSPLMFRASSPRQHRPSHSGSHLQFSNDAPFWNPSAAAMKDVRSSFSPALLIDEKSKNLPGFSAVNKSGMGTEPSTKKTRNETPSPLPAFKVRKEKMGDRITALQQLVSPFGKTDTASVLSEAIEYIKILHEQVDVLSGPYMKSGATIQQHQQDIDHATEDQEEHDEDQDLRSRGLCLVPVASTYPIAHDPTLDFWAPPFGGSYR